jgi:hypothetical protein
MVQQGLDGYRLMMDACRVVALSGAVAASTQAGKVNSLIPILKMGRRKMAAATSRVSAMVRAGGQC